MVKLKDIADALGVSLTVVSRVLNPKPDKYGFVAEATRELVLKKAAEMGYRRNRSAEFLARGGRSANIGVFLPLTANSLIAELIMGISEGSNRHGFPVNYFFGFSEESYMNFFRHVSGNANSAMITYPSLTCLRLLHGTVAQYIAEGGKVAFIAPYNFDFQYDGALIMGVDNVLGGRIAAERLIERHCRHFLNCHPAEQLDGLRSRGFLQTLTAQPVESDEPAGILKQLRKWRPEDFSENAPLGIFAHSDSVALQLMRAVRDTRWRVGGNLLIIGYDNSFLTDQLPVTLTTIGQPFRQLGETLMDRVVELLYDRPVRSEMLAPFLVPRESA